MGAVSKLSWGPLKAALVMDAVRPKEGLRIVLRQEGLSKYLGLKTGVATVSFELLETAFREVQRHRSGSATDAGGFHSACVVLHQHGRNVHDGTFQQRRAELLEGEVCRTAAEMAKLSDSCGRWTAIARRRKRFAI